MKIEYRLPQTFQVTVKLQENKMDNKGYWYNFKTESYEYIESPTDFADYIPQSPPAQSLYKLYIEIGDDPLEASIKVLKASIGEKPEA